MVTISEVVVAGISLGGEKLELDGRYRGGEVMADEFNEFGDDWMVEQDTVERDTQPAATEPCEDVVKVNVRAACTGIMDAMLAYHEVCESDRPLMDQAINEISAVCAVLESKVTGGTAAVFITSHPCIIKDAVRAIDSLIKAQHSGHFDDHHIETLECIVTSVNEVTSAVKVSRRNFHEQEKQ